MPLPAGSRLGPYEIVSPIGAGGMGEVYRALDTRLNRQVALKVMSAEKTIDADRRRRFIQEAQSASALNHPGIVTIFDVGSDQGIDYLTMELIDGRTVEQLLPRGGFAVAEVLRLGVQIADALARAHSSGIVHRDLKPGNVMVTSDGQVKVLDFGLAKVVHRNDTSTVDETKVAATKSAQGLIVGTVSYMSPEQAEGRPVDARSDVFSFGAMLYEMVTGRQPFRGDTPISTLSSILRDEPTPPTDGRADVPSDLAKIIRRSLRKDPARRFQTMADLRVALLELKEESDSGLLNATVPVPASMRQRVGITTIAAATLTAIVLIGGAAYWFLRTPASRAGPAAASLRPTPLTSYVGDENAPTFSPDASQIAFSWNGEAQDNYDIYVKVVGPGMPLRLTTDPHIDFSPAWSPDGRSVAFVRRSGTALPADLRILAADAGLTNAIMLMPALGGNERVLTKFAASPYARLLAWSPDSKWLVVAGTLGGPQKLHLISVETGEIRTLTAPPRDIDGDVDPSFSPDGRTIAYARAFGLQLSEIRLLKLSDTLATLGDDKLASEGQFPRSPAWMPDGRELVYSTGIDAGSAIYRIGVNPPAAPVQMPWLGDGAAAPVIASKSPRLAYERYSRNSTIWRIDTQQKTLSAAPFITSTSREAFPQYSPDGKRIVFYSSRSGTNQIWMCDADGARLTQLTTMTGTITGSPRWAPDSQRISFDSNSSGNWQIYVLDVDGGQPRPLTTDPALHVVASWSRDGKWVYFMSRKGGNEDVWKIPSAGGEPVQVTRNGGAAPVESPDGQALYFTRSRGTESVLLQMPVGGGAEKELAAIHRYNFAVTSEGVYYDTITRPGSPSEIHYLELKTGRDTKLFTLAKPVDLGLAVSPDRRYILFAQNDFSSRDLMLAETIR